ncbi:uncharacterized protein LOC135293847 isoform X2 [Passer domesticus]|uniref:uncharacterized protein LOC135293847 isoform X2 n=1 Tax=Passer domesticus TaxID=48849 RepID=UPI0030FE8A17
MAAAAGGGRGRGFCPRGPRGEGPSGKVCAVPGAAAGGSWRRQNKAARGAEAAAAARGLRSPPTPSSGTAAAYPHVQLDVMKLSVDVAEVCLQRKLVSTDDGTR